MQRKVQYRKLTLLILLIIVLVLAGCSEKNVDNSTKDHHEKKQPKNEQSIESSGNVSKQETTTKIFDNLPELPTTAEDLITQSPGKFADQEILSDEIASKVKEEIKDLPPLNENPSEEELNEYMKYIYSLVATDFQDPNDLLNKWEFSMSGNPDLPESRFQFKDNYNIEIILDSSGSMANTINGKTMMELAKESINNFLSSLPKEANISLRVYGHKGSGADSDKALSCSSIEQVYGFGPYKQTEFNQSLNKFKPSGWTPIAKALEESKQSLAKFDAKTNTNLIYLVSDGVETCDGDPVKVAKSFASSNVAPIINVIGFNVDSEAQKQLKQVAESANGIYTTVTSGDQLKKEFQRAEEVLKNWGRWKKDSIRSAEALRVDNSFDILELTNDWGYRATRQNLNIGYMLSILRDEGKITFKQEDQLKKIRKNIKELVIQTKKEMEGNLKEINIKEIEDLKKKINEKYNTNTQQ
ncbi:VWA domain-containing protein [Heyndrickxia oleronia]|uniref:VWA domain-containing protein n=1 Tax=Heyndrickxia oleronia TaxID=38875 RepID=UPI00242C930B|nr:VWA domain-containing protein [Heyndrickxia oleronia]MCI1591750.1 VWA domain-containing protein [Heyndrickxia oleronia]MCI1614950.1 VWA domain-containing protein [Heyndrickxia oleronia]MCI1745817.1 VWA domain-containing protein [Heyndrickxia oleronia]MCI1763716.1 VWA domain-containing protein [Heyndrickxia oleronia]